MTAIAIFATIATRQIKSEYEPLMDRIELDSCPRWLIKMEEKKMFPILNEYPVQRDPDLDTSAARIRPYERLNPNSTPINLGASPYSKKGFET